MHYLNYDVAVGEPGSLYQMLNALCVSLPTLQPASLWSPSSKTIRRPTCPMMATRMKGSPEGDEGRAVTETERGDYLKQLYGDAAGAKIGERQAPPPPPPSADEPDIAMLQDGMQGLGWGQTRLVDVDMAVGPLELTLEPLLNGSRLLAVRLEMPLGMVLEEDAPVPSKAVAAPVVVDLLEEGTARVGGIRLGDVVRATTYMTMGVRYETWQLMLGGGGTPALQKALMPTANQDFEQVLLAIASNSRTERGNGQIVLLVERPAAREDD